MLKKIYLQFSSENSWALTRNVFVDPPKLNAPETMSDRTSLNNTGMARDALDEELWEGSMDGLSAPHPGVPKMQS